MESFESLTPTNGAVLEASLSLAGFELSAPYGENLVVFDTPSDGMSATHGSRPVSEPSAAALLLLALAGLARGASAYR